VASIDGLIDWYPGNLSVYLFVDMLLFCYMTNKFFLRYDTRCYFNVRSKADMSRLNLPHGDDN